MSDNSSGKPRPGDPSAPKIPHSVYISEKDSFAGLVIGSICYGVVIVLFFRCITALFCSVNCAGRGIRWGLVVYTATVFSFVTILTAMNMDILSISYIDNRGFPGHNGSLPPGPFEYQRLINTDAINVVPNVMFILNTWLTDGLLLYRCYVIYAMNYWAMVFPCLMYLASLATGIAFTYYEVSQPIVGKRNRIAHDFDFPYFAISLSLNIILTLMIVARLVLRNRNIRNAMGAPGGAGVLRNAVVTMLVESFALYAVSYLLFIVPWSLGSSISSIFSPILAETQVIAPFLIILRVAGRRSVTSDVVLSDTTPPSLRESTGGNDVFPDIHPTSSMDMHRDILGELDVGLDTKVDRVRTWLDLVPEGPPEN